MAKKMILFLFFWLTLAAVGLAGCKSQPTQPPRRTSQAPALANPASVYCQGLGYREEKRVNEAGEYSACLFPDGAECDSWGFLAGVCEPQRSYCASQGYTLKSKPNSNIGMCEFPDGSTCDEYQFFLGECQPGED